jgi:hypothetical protein
MSWTSERFEAVARRSQGLHGNKHLLPVAVAIAELDRDAVKAPELRVALGGHVEPNRLLEALERLCAIEVLEELPYPGRPHPRMFRRLPSAYWGFVAEFAAEASHTSTGDS